VAENPSELKVRLGGVAEMAGLCCGLLCPPVAVSMRCWFKSPAVLNIRRFVSLLMRLRPTVQSREDGCLCQGLRALVHLVDPGQFAA